MGRAAADALRGELGSRERLVKYAAARSRVRIAGFPGGLALISARVGTVTGTWAVSGAFLRTGRGRILPVSYTAAAVTRGGSTREAKRLRITVATLGYADSLECLRRS